jgi:ubiquinone/menaquinone biosynthesis C-methylase UbiE
MQTLESRLRRENLEVVLNVAKAEDTVFCESCIDMVFFSIVLHDFQDQHKVLQNSRTMIKKRGLLVNIDWKKESPFGPPEWKKFSPQKAISLIEEAGFKIVDVVDDHEYLYTITAMSS